MKKKLVISIIMLIIGIGCALFCFIPSGNKQTTLVKQYVNAVAKCDAKTLQKIVDDSFEVEEETVTNYADYFVFSYMYESGFDFGQIKEVKDVNLVDAITQEDGVLAVIEIKYENLDEDVKTQEILQYFTFVNALGNLKIEL